MLYNHHQHDYHGNRSNFFSNWVALRVREKFMTFSEQRKIRKILRRLWGQRWWMKAITTTCIYRFKLYTHAKSHTYMRKWDCCYIWCHLIFTTSGSVNKLFIRQGMFNISYYLTKWRSWFSYFGLISINNSWGGRISCEGRQ